jgi:predicted nucleic acid-binding protein
MVIVDSSVWIDYLADRYIPETSWLDSRAAKEAVGLTDLALAEVLQGIRDDSQFDAARARLMKLRVLTAGGPMIAIASALNYRTLRAKGITVRKNRLPDCDLLHRAWPCAAASRPRLRSV